MKTIGRLFAATMMTVSVLADTQAFAEDKPAKELFGAVKLPSAEGPAPHGFYAKGCMSGAVAIPMDGPTWQAMRPSRNRRWGQPQMIALLEKLSQDASKLDGWPGLLLGDIAQPRGGPMLSGHASHQIGLDADIWLTPMPAKTLTTREREDMSAVSMLKKGAFLTVDDNIWTPAHARVIMRAASYPQVERIFVNPSIKKKLCDTWTGDRSDLGKVRPYYGHDYHFHVRMKCPPGATDCKGQAAVPAGDGCDKSLAWWFTKEPWAAPTKDPNKKPPPPPKPMMLADLPKACTVALQAPGPASEAAVTAGGGIAPNAFAPPAAPAPSAIPADVPVPLVKPMQN